MKPRERERLLLAAEGYFRSGHPGHAKLVLENLLAAGDASSKAHELLGYIHGNEGELEAAHRHLEIACRLPRRSPAALYYLGVSYLRRKQARLAIEALDRSIALGGQSFEVWHDLGTAHAQSGDSQSALACYAKAERFNPHSFDLAFNAGKVYDEIKDFANAIAQYDRALQLDPGVADVWAHKGAALYDTKRYAEAIEHWQRALALDPAIEFLLGFLVHARLRMCDWSRWESDRAELSRRIAAGENACTPFEILAISASEDVQRRVAERWVAQNFAEPAVAAAPVRQAGDRIRVGYYSADFGRHPVSYLTAELYERHDRERFEVLAFAFERAPAGDETRARLERGFDRFIDVKGRSDGEIASLSRDLGIDIAVDLGGHTKGSRAGVLMRRAAPVQVNFLGFPGTMGADFIDYIVADAAAIPLDNSAGYSERLVHMPDCFQPSDTRTLPAPTSAERSAYGLPAQGFVFCCFNNSYKITPEVFAVWMRILERVPGSCLWLLAEVDAVETNLRREAVRHAVDGDRLIFGRRVPYGEYLGRYRCADLFLDTLPFNGGTTVNDALWAGLPVLTRTGSTFAGRMATSLLRTLQLPQLIASSAEEYESIAVGLGRVPAELGRVAEKLASNRTSGALFDIAAYTRHLEAAYRTMHERAQAGIAPQHIVVPREPRP